MIDINEHLSAVSEADSSAIGRRQFLSGAAGALAALYLSSGEKAQAMAAPSKNSTMLKAINTEFLAPATGAVGTIEFIQNGGADAAIIWAPLWTTVEPEPGQHEKSAWKVADANYATAVALGKPIYMAVSCEYPLWAFDKHAHKLKDRTPNGPIVNFWQSIIDRYPKIDGLIYLNEPNLYFEGDPNRVRHTAELMITADKIAHSIGYDGLLLGPAATDVRDGRGIRFLKDVLTELHRQNFKPISHHGVASHHYGDVKAGSVHGVKNVVRLIDQAWLGDEKNLFLTEGGLVYDTHSVGKYVYDYDKPLEKQELKYHHHMLRHLRWCRRSGRVALWANYTLQDEPNGGGGFMSGLFKTDGTPHMALTDWRQG